MLLEGRDYEQEARLIPDHVTEEDFAIHRHNVQWNILQAERNEALVQELIEVEQVVPEKFKHGFHMKRLQAESCARVFRRHAHNCQQIVERLECQNALWLEKDGKEVEELERLFREGNVS